jgi:hypothetical protein
MARRRFSAPPEEHARRYQAGRHIVAANAASVRQALQAGDCLGAFDALVLTSFAEGETEANRTSKQKVTRTTDRLAQTFAAKCVRSRPPK